MRRGSPPAGSGATVGPLLRQIELAIQQGVAQPTGIGHKDADLTTFDAAGGPAVLAGHAGRVVPFFQKAGFIDDQYGVWVPEMLQDIGAQLIPHGLWIPQRPAQQVLKAVWCRVAAHLGQLPAVLALGGAEQAPQVGHRPLPGLGALEIGRQPALDIVQVRGPSADDRYLLVNQERGRFVHQHHDSTLHASPWNHDTATEI